MQKIPNWVKETIWQKRALRVQAQEIMEKSFLIEFLGLKQC